MTNRKITITHNDIDYNGEVATIKSTTFGWEDHGILTAYLQCEWPGNGIGVGGFGLDETTGSPDYNRVGTGYGLDHLMKIMETVGVHKWEDLPGKSVIILFAESGSVWGSTAKGIAHITDEKRVLILAEHAENWKQTHGNI